jgi:fatty-acyl-CoA synthase
MSTSRRSYFHRGGEPALLGSTIPEHLWQMAAHFPEREAVVSVHQRRRLSYARLMAEADRVARGLLALGFGKGDRIGVWSTNNIEWLLLQLATARIGAILVNINPAYRQRELAYALKKSEVQGLFTIPRFRKSDYLAILEALLPQLDRCRAEELAAGELPDLRRVILFDPETPEHTLSPLRGVQVWQDLLAASEAVDPAHLDKVSAALDPDDPINIQYTSGTTGFPKAVLLTHHNILNNAWFSAQAMNLCERDRLAVPVPFYHCFGMVLANLLALSVGACIVLPCEHFDAAAVLHAIQRESCTALHGVPTMFIAQLEHPAFPTLDLTSLRTGIMAGAPCPPALMRRVMEDMHCPEILIGYGETEASPLTHLTLPGDGLQRRTQTVGHNLPHQEVKIVSLEDGRTLPIGEIGEVCFRGYHIMRGYYADREATDEAIDPAGWLHSGDLGRMDPEGYLAITGRRKEMIIRGGENIYPREIEELIFSHPKVAQVAVFGIPDDYYGEEVAAWIQTHADEEMTSEEVRDFCRERIAHFKVPRHIRFVSEFPMTVTGKLQKFRMRELEGELRSAPVPTDGEQTPRVG